MITIKGTKIPETKKLGCYDLKEVITSFGRLDLEIYKGDEYIIGFIDCSIHDFDSQEEIDAEIKYWEEEMDAENAAEGRMARAGW